REPVAVGVQLEPEHLVHCGSSSTAATPRSSAAALSGVEQPFQASALPALRASRTPATRACTPALSAFSTLPASSSSVAPASRTAPLNALKVWVAVPMRSSGPRTSGFPARDPRAPEVPSLFVNAPFAARALRVTGRFGAIPSPMNSLLLYQ